MQSTPTISSQPTQADDLASEKGVDYTKLRDLLAAHNWKEADEETYRVMIQAVGKKDGDWFTSEELLNFPCTDLRTIDHLWVEYSNGQFGFSVQKEIYLSVGGKPDGKYYEEAWKYTGRSRRDGKSNESVEIRRVSARRDGKSNESVENWEDVRRRVTRVATRRPSTRGASSWGGTDRRRRPTRHLPTSVPVDPTDQTPPHLRPLHRGGLSLAHRDL
ncbi:GUN4 domain-containing protein [Fischerella sp. PCC 9605]|uniref:GUN4 domain-containing protein n=1 Tax=Fischerella sp. PCC 9605 TaxID=1173024 RepID=UPI0009E1D616|nr:GUN4 domain-containing protein [Fischerella sp. PCC 9605]